MFLLQNISLTQSYITLYSFYQMLKRAGQKKLRNSEKYETIVTFPRTKCRPTVRRHNSIQSHVCSTILHCWKKEPCV